MNIYRKFKKSTKALSPVVASIILIAVTVAVSVVVAAWMGGMTINLMGTAEQGVITNLQFTDGGVADDTIIATVQNTGDVALTITGGFVNGNEANSITPGTAMTIAKGDTETFTLALDPGTLVDATQYQIKLTTAKGNAIAYTSTYLAP
jgi:flagellin-like protein